MHDTNNAAGAVVPYTIYVVDQSGWNHIYLLMALKNFHKLKWKLILILRQYPE